MTDMFIRGFTKAHSTQESNQQDKKRVVSKFPGVEGILGPLQQRTREIQSMLPSVLGVGIGGYDPATTLSSPGELDRLAKDPTDLLSAKEHLENRLLQEDTGADVRGDKKQLRYGATNDPVARKLSPKQQRESGDY